MDFADALDQLDPKIKVVYADPPYTRDHYSRFYHILETICLRDLPNISTTKIGGALKLSRGLYREERHQSPFCIKSQALISFEKIFKKTSAHGASLVLSYSPFDKKNKDHPRVVTIEQLLKLASTYYSDVSTIDIDGITHSKLNNKEKNLKRKMGGEVLIVCKI
jgi:adenine-specific DNA methylase